MKKILKRIDGRGYKAYKDIEGAYRVGAIELYIDHVQADPFAPPSKLRLRMPMEVAHIPRELFSTRVRKIALEDYLARVFKGLLKKLSKGKRGTGKSGVITIDAGGQEVLKRTAIKITEDWVEARIQVGLPARGRTILGKEAIDILLNELPEIASRALIYNNLETTKLRDFIECVENQEYLRERLYENGLVAFIADNSVLPRESGVSELPMDEKIAVPFRSPPELKVEFELPNPARGRYGNSRKIRGMGIPEGVNLIVGGGFHGKSTLLDAIMKGVYPHVPGDGREYVVTIREAVMIRAEDGRRIEKVDISPFISNLPFGKDTREFSTDDASGSTSQAANIIEAIEVGAKLLLVDEDTSATNFMVRDARMQSLVHKESEPITPFIDRVGELYREHDISTILVMGGSGDYFDVATRVIMMKEYEPYDRTGEAKRIAEIFPTRRKKEIDKPFAPNLKRVPLKESVSPRKGKKEVKIDAKAVDILRFGRETIDLRYVEGIVDISQTRAIGYILNLMRERFMDGRRTLRELIELMEDLLDKEGLDILTPDGRRGRHPGNFAMPRRFEIAAALNRLRTLKVLRR